MGRDKAMLSFGPDEVLLQRVVRLVAKVVPQDRIVCVAAEGQLLPSLPAGIHVLRDDQPHCGPLAGLAAGIAALYGRAAATFACGCDTPLLVPGFIVRMFERLADHQIAVPQDGEQLHPLAAVYRADVLPIAESLLAAGERSLQALLRRCDLCRVPTDDLRDVDPDLASLRSCNTPAEYRGLLKQIGVDSE